MTAEVKTGAAAASAQVAAQAGEAAAQAATAEQGKKAMQKVPTRPSLRDAVFSPATLVMLLVLMVCAAIWWFGPLLAVGGVAPLATGVARVLVIALLLAAALLTVKGWPRSPVVIVALALLVWWAGPLLAVDGAYPLRPAWVRAAAIGTLVFAYTVWAVWRLLQAIHKDGSILKRLMAHGEAGPEPAVAEEVRGMGVTARRAVARLRDMRGRGGWLRRAFDGRRYLYELPWYAVIGAAGVGKSTAVQNAGLQFPLAPELGDRQGGTLQWGWWFTNDAVLVDTAGRFTRHTDSDDEQGNAAGWLGLLGVLRRVRPRAPLNGAVVMVDASRLVTADAQAVRDLALNLRLRLEEMRSTLGVRFPVYLVLTKCDALAGFGEYFASLTAEARAQVWGVTLPWEGLGRAPGWWPGRHAQAARLGDSLRTGLDALGRRVAQGAAMRLQEEFESQRRQGLYKLPHDFERLQPLLLTLIDEAFADSRFDATAASGLLRGVYFSSAAQSTPFLERGALKTHQEGVAAPVTPRGYFLGDLFSRLVFAESQLVRPNLRLESRLRLAGWLGHSLVIVVLAWLGTSLWWSHGNNGQYLQGLASRAQLLKADVATLAARFDASLVPGVLGAAQDLPHQPGLDMADPPLAYRYGLYTGEPMQRLAGAVYSGLQNHLLLPTVASRMAGRLAQALQAEDAELAYETLRVYLMLFEPERFVARDVRAWIARDWQEPDGLAPLLGGRAVLLQHLQSLFSGQQALRAPGVPDAALVQRVRDWLDGTTVGQRLYERTKAQLAEAAPADFTLVRALGPQAGTLFVHASGQPLERGIPGLFTHDGYHQVFAPRLHETIARAAEDDAWAMGRRRAGRAGAADTGDAAPQGANPTQTLADAVRRQYLQEYARHWEAFLDDVRVVGGANLAFDLTVVRQLAAPDSPLVRLARAAARETTLSMPLVPSAGRTGPGSGDALAQATADGALAVAGTQQRALGVRPEARMERAEVDDRFAALREVVTGQVDAQAAAATAAAARPPGLEAVTGLINDYYTVLVVADTALSGGAVPPGVADVGTRMRLEAQRLPAPLREVLLGLGTAGATRVAEGAQTVLRQQARAQLDRINGLLALQVTEPCRRAAEGRYPFVGGEGAAEITAEDFQQLFASGGMFDDYFGKNLLPYVDQSVRPWRYRAPATAAMLVPAAMAADGTLATAPAPAQAGPTLAGELLRLLAESGPDLAVFWRAAQIREAFFRDGGKRLGWKVDLRVAELDPSITELVMDVDGQGQRYAHGPVQPWPVSWPGPRGGASAELVALPRIRADTSALRTQGPWALMRLLERGRLAGTATPGRLGVEFTFDGRRAVLDLAGGASAPLPLTPQLLRDFGCPGGRRTA